MTTIERLFVEKLQGAIGHMGYGSQADIAEKLNMSRGTFNNMLKGRRGTNEEIRRAISKIIGIDYDEIIREADRIVTAGGAQSLVQSEYQPQPDFTLVPKYRAKLSGGHGSLENSDQIETNLAFRTTFVRKKGNPDKMALFEITGDSMEPFLYDGDVVLVDLAQNEPAQIVDGKAYAFREDQTIKVKRLSIQGTALIASSENTHKYPPYKVDEGMFSLIGRVLLVGHEVR
jgi:phage repressor protein C with HTH and peptisase S24 domain